MKTHHTGSHAAVLAALGAALWGTSVHASPQNSQPNGPIPFTVTGKITKLSAGKLTLSTGENIFFVVRYDAKTQIFRADGSAGSDRDLQIGNTVEVAGSLAENGDILAKTIRIEPAKAEKSPER